MTVAEAIKSTVGLSDGKDLSHPVVVVVNWIDSSPGFEDRRGGMEF